jgi:hypothetical protein
MDGSGNANGSGNGFGWGAFVRETEEMLAALSQLERGLLNGTAEAAEPPVSPRQRLLSPEYLRETQQEQGINLNDLNDLPAKGNVYRDYEADSPRHSPPPPPPHWSSRQDGSGGPGLGLGSLLGELFRMGTQLGEGLQSRSFSTSTRYDSTTGETETVMRATHRVNDQTITCVQRFWENAVTRQRRQEGECHDAQGRRVEPQLERQLLAQAPRPLGLTLPH